MANWKTQIEEKLWWLPFGRVPEVSATELQSRFEAGDRIQLLDVRTTLEWRRSRIRGAVHISIIELRGRLPTIDFDPNRQVVAICLSAHRSIPAVRLLRRHGYRDVVQLAGGMTAWWRAKLPTVGEA